MSIVFWCLGILLFFLLLYLFMIMPRMTRKPDLTPLLSHRYAHRGLHGKLTGLPENSMAAFRKAVEQGYGMELDIHLTKDGQLVIMHDESLLRTCGTDKKICDMTLEELSSYRLEGTEEHIPTFDEFLNMVDGQVPLILELKPTWTNIAALSEAVCRRLETYKGPFCLESFDPRVLMWLKKHKPQYIRGQLSMHFTKEEKLAFPIRWAMRNLLANFLAKPDFIAYCYQDRKKLSPTLCRKLYHCQEFSWTITELAWQKIVESDGGRIIFEQYDTEAE